MAEMNTVVEGKVKFRDGKKWKPRWCVMKKPSPVAGNDDVANSAVPDQNASYSPSDLGPHYSNMYKFVVNALKDRLQVFLYKDVKESVKGGSPKSNFPLDGFYGLESGICYDKETSVLAIICHKLITLLAFDSRETLIQFEIKIRRSLGVEHQFPVRTIKVPSQSKLPLDLVRLHIHGQKFCLTAHIPPKILCSWQVSELRRFGNIDGKFCFEGGSRCGKGQGFHILQTDQADEIAEIIGHASSGKSAPIIRRQTSKRRSEILEPFKNVTSDNLFKKFQNVPVYVDQNYHDDQQTWPHPKRHSISFTDYRRTKTYTEKQRLMSIENVEKERLMAIYDIPPRRVRKVESVQSSCDGSSATPVRNFDVNLEAYKSVNAQSPQGYDNYLNWTGEFNNNVMSYQVPTSVSSYQVPTSACSYQVPTSISVSSNQSDTSSSYSGSVLSLQSVDPPSNIPISSSAPALCGYGNQMLTNRFLESSRSVPNQIAGEGGHCEVRGRNEVLQSLQQTEEDLEKEMTLLDEMLQVCQKEESRYEDSPPVPPPLPLKISNCRRKSADQFLTRGSLDNLSISSDRTHTRPSPRSGYSASILLSPNLISKLKKIPNRSQMNAPLRYVNLSKYDIGDVDTNHVHLPAAASTSAPDGTGSWNERQRSKGYDNVRDDSMCANKENKRISMSLPGSRENLRNITGSDSHLNLSKSRSISYSNEPIYANEHCETPPPPELPPKGPALANRSKQRRAINASSRPPPPPRPPDRHQSLQQRSDRPRTHQYQSPRQGTNPVYPTASPQEDYFLMGDFEKEPPYNLYNSESQRLNESLFDRPVVSLPPRGKGSTRLDASACYMEMSGQSELERTRSFNDADSVCSDGSGISPRPKYVRSLSASGAANASMENESLASKFVASVDYLGSATAENSPREQRKEVLIREENYMLMSSVSPKKPVLQNLKSLQDYVSTTPAGDGYVDSGSDNSALKCDNDSENGNGAFVRISYVDVNDEAVKSRTESFDTDYNVVKPEMPFENLIDFKQQPPATVRSTKMIELSIPGGKSMIENTSSKTPGFFSRLMRRNSRDRKSISQSHENLLSTSSSEPTIKEGVVLVESSSSAAIYESSGSEESNRSQSSQDLVLDPKDRSRSSSFPNRASFIAMNESTSSSSTGISILSQHSDLGATNSSLNSFGTVSTHTSSNDCQAEEGANTDNVFTDSDKDGVKGSYETQSYYFAGQLENRIDEVESEVNAQLETRGECSLSDECKEGEQVGEVNTKEETVSECNSNKPSQDKHGGKVFTVLNVQGGHFSQNSCKTDDEKLIELWHSTHSLCSDKSEKDSIADIKSKMTLPLEELSPDEKANAIARHISSLPPFIPPKMKNYPSKLSPVLERVTPKKDRPGPLSGAVSTVDGDSEKVESPVLSPSMMKQQAKATLRITPPSEDEHGKIWIPRSAQPEEEVPEETIDKKITTLVVDVSDLEQTDCVSLSSQESSCFGEEVVRSSPASTILRPRSGKEYQKIERRRTVDDSNTTSPLTTPQSPATGSVFTFELMCPPSASSGYGCYGDMHSPKFTKMSQSEQTSMCASSLRSESIGGAKAMYMNIDFSPPDSPLLLPGGMSGVPAEQVEPQLNYAEIDLSETGRLENALQMKKLNYAEMDHSLSERAGGSFRQSKKGRKTPEPVPIEYSMIDMVATRAAQKARKEHAQSREGSLRRDRISISSASGKDRSLNLSMRSERKQASASSAAQSSNSVDSTTF